MSPIHEVEFDSEQAQQYQPIRLPRTAVLAEKPDNEVSLIETETGRQRFTGSYYMIMYMQTGKVLFCCNQQDWEAMYVPWLKTKNSWHPRKRAEAYMLENGDWMLHLGDYVTSVSTLVFEYVFDINSAQMPVTR